MLFIDTAVQVIGLHGSCHLHPEDSFTLP